MEIKTNTNKPTATVWTPMWNTWKMLKQVWTITEAKIQSYYQAEIESQMLGQQVAITGRIKNMEIQLETKAGLCTALREGRGERDR